MPNSFNLRLEKGIKGDGGDPEASEVISRIDLIIKLGLNKSVSKFRVDETSLEQIFQQ